MDISEWHENQTETEIMLLPIYPVDEPVGLAKSAAELWRRIVDGPISSDSLSDEERTLLGEFEVFGIASRDEQHPARVSRLEAPWLKSPVHEIVYALVASLARDRGLDAMVLKGPLLHRQGLREREHSGDVDLWVSPRKIQELTVAMREWGWGKLPVLWEDLPIHHSVTLAPEGGWGCELDIHRRMPGLAFADEEAFQAVFACTEPVRFAGVRCLGLGKAANAVLYALHEKRPDIGVGMTESGSNRALEVLRLGGAEVPAYAERFGALRALEEELVLAYPEHRFDFASAGAPRDWESRMHRTKAGAYFFNLRQVPWYRLPHFVFRILWPSADVARNSELLAGGTDAHPLKMRLRRLQRGISAALTRSR